MGYLVAKSLTHQLQLTNTTQCAISLKEYASGDCLPWINADGWLLFVSFGAYQRICRRVRDPSHDELEGAVRLRVCLEMLWVGLLQTRTSIDDSIKLFRDFDCVSPACRMFIRDRFRQACLIASGGVGPQGMRMHFSSLPAQLKLVEEIASVHGETLSVQEQGSIGGAAGLQVALT